MLHIKTSFKIFREKETEAADTDCMTLNTSTSVRDIGDLHQAEAGPDVDVSGLCHDQG